jgi:hypothetical protein
MAKAVFTCTPNPDEALLDLVRQHSSIWREWGRLDHPNWRGQKARVALVDQARLAEVRRQLEEALGSLASFEVLTGESGEDKP